MKRKLKILQNGPVENDTCFGAHERLKVSLVPMSVLKYAVIRHLVEAGLILIKAIIVL
jgi:hypothetical protein